MSIQVGRFLFYLIPPFDVTFVLPSKKISMDFFDSIKLPFHLWQFICLSPYELKLQQNQSHPSNFHRNCTITVIILKLLVVILSGVFFNEIVSPDLKQTIRVLDGLTMLLAQFAALIILWESFKKRRVQRNFFHKINSIDFVMEFKLGVRPDYERAKKTNARRLIGWLVVIAANFLTNFVIMSIVYDIAYRWWAVFFASYFFCSLRYHQISTCVDVIHCRYQLLNQFINRLSKDNRNDDDDADDNVNSKWPMFNVAETLMANAPVTVVNPSDSIYEKLHHLRRVCRLLSSANHNVNEAFQFSIPLIIVNDFLQILINWFWILRILLRPKIRLFHLVPPLFWTLVNFIHVVSLSATCHRATEAVSFFRCSTLKAIAEPCKYTDFYVQIPGKKCGRSSAKHRFSQSGFSGPRNGMANMWIFNEY